MNALDLVLVVVAAVYLVAGYQQGFVIGAASTFGLLSGGALGVAVAPVVLRRYDPSLQISFAALLIVITLAFLGQVDASTPGVLSWRRWPSGSPS